MKSRYIKSTFMMFGSELIYSKFNRCKVIISIYTAESFKKCQSTSTIPLLLLSFLYLYKISF